MIPLRAKGPLNSASEHFRTRSCSFRWVFFPHVKREAFSVILIRNHCLVVTTGTQGVAPPHLVQWVTGHCVWPIQKLKRCPKCSFYRTQSLKVLFMFLISREALQREGNLPSLCAFSLTHRIKFIFPGDLGLIPGSRRSSGEGNGYILQYSYPENPMDRAAWRATVHGVAKSQTRLSD